MSQIISNGVVGDTANVNLTADSRVVMSGNFAGARIKLDLTGDGGEPYSTYYEKPNAIFIKAATGNSLTATIIDGNKDSTPSIDISVI